MEVSNIRKTYTHQSFVYLSIGSSSPSSTPLNVIYFGFIVNQFLLLVSIIEESLPSVQQQKTLDFMRRIIGRHNGFSSECTLAMLLRMLMGWDTLR